MLPYLGMSGSTSDRVGMLTSVKSRSWLAVQSGLACGSMKYVKWLDDDFIQTQRLKLVLFKCDQSMYNSSGNSDLLVQPQNKGCVRNN